VRAQRIQDRVAERLNEVSDRDPPYSQGHISAYEHGDRLTPEVVRDYVAAYQLDRHEVGATLLGNDFHPVDRSNAFDNLVDSDPLLDERTKAHLKYQYAILRDYVAQQRFHDYTDEDDDD